MTDLVICSHSRERKSPSYSRINTVSQNSEMTGRSQLLFFTLCILNKYFHKKGGGQVGKLPVAGRLTYLQ